MQIIKLNKYYINRFEDLLDFLTKNNKDTFEFSLILNQIENNVLKITNEQFIDIYDNIIEHKQFIDILELLTKNERNLLKRYE